MWTDCKHLEMLTFLVAALTIRVRDVLLGVNSPPKPRRRGTAGVTRWTRADCTRFSGSGKLGRRVAGRPHHALAVAGVSRLVTLRSAPEAPDSIRVFPGTGSSRPYRKRHRYHCRAPGAHRWPRLGHDRGCRHRHRHDGGADGQAVPGVFPGVLHHSEQIRRHRPRPRHQPTLLPHHGRRHHGGRGSTFTIRLPRIVQVPKS
jgi:hypothetical protein